MMQSKKDTSDLVNLLSRPGFHAEGDPELTIVQAWLSGAGDDLDGVSETVALAAVEAASRQGRLELLSGIREGGSPWWLRKAAARAIHAARARGVTGVPEATARVFRLETGATDPLRKALLMPMPQGWLLFLTASEGDAHFGAWTEIDRVGQFLRLQVLRGDRSRTRSVLRNFTRDPSTAELPFVSGLTLALRAVEAPSSQGGGAPIVWVDFLQVVPEPTIQAARILDPWRDFERDFDLARLKADEALASECCPVDAITDGETVDRFGERIMEEINRSYLLPDSSPNDVIERVLHGFIEEYLGSGNGRERLASSFDLHALYRRQRNREDEARTLRESALALREGIAGDEIPLVRAYFKLVFGAAMESLSLKSPESDKK